MDHVEEINGYHITYNNGRCRHTNLRGFRDKPNYMCMKCGAECQFCESCEKVFTVRTLRKHGGECGTCTKRQSRIIEPDINLHHPRAPPPGLPPLFPLQLLFHHGPNGHGHEEEESGPVQKESLIRVPHSEIHMKDDDEKEEYEQGEFIVKNVLAEDSQKKLWLVEWDHSQEATWETFDTLKDTKVFQEYIERQMIAREGINLMSF